MISKRVVLSMVAVGLLSGCGGGLFGDKDDIILEGDRISVLELQKSLEPDDYVLEEQGLLMPEAWKNDFWPQAGGYPNHSMQNLVLSEGALSRVWSVDIGQGAEDELPLTALPIVVDGKVYTLDTEGVLSSFAADNGDRLWRINVLAVDEDDAVIAGGLSFASGLVLVTNGYNEVLAVNPNNGDIVWRVDVPSPARAAPTVIDGRVFVTTLDSRILALDVADGRVIWEYSGVAEGAGLVGAAAPAANADVVVPVFSSGDVMALRVENGSVAWADSLSNVRGFGGLGEIADIKAMPVIDKGLVFVMSFSGKFVAIDERTGQRVWQREISGSETPWIAGNHLFVLSSENQLIAMGRDTGVVRWVTELPRFDDDEPVVLKGPILAGGRLIVAGTDGRVIEVNPENGALVRSWDAGATVVSAPIVAGGTLYLLFENGTLGAYR